MRTIEIIACKISLAAVVAYIVRLGVVAMDWKPLAFACAVIIFYFYRDKITMIAFKDIRVELSHKIEQAEEILAAINSIAYNLSCVSLKQLSVVLYSGIMFDTELFKCITRIDDLNKLIACNKEKHEPYTRLRNEALLNCVIFVVEKARASAWESSDKIKSEKLSLLWRIVADNQSKIACGNSVKKKELLSIILEYRQYLSDLEFDNAEFYISQMEDI